MKKIFTQFNREIPEEVSGKYVFFLKRDAVGIINSALEAYKGAFNSFHEEGLMSRRELELDIKKIDDAISEWKAEIDSYRINPFTNDN